METVPKDGYDCFFSREVYDKNTVSADYLEFLKIKDKEINDRQLEHQVKEVTITVPAAPVRNPKTTESSLVLNHKEDVPSTSRTSHTKVKADQDDSTKKGQAMPDSINLKRHSISKESLAYKPTLTDVSVHKPTPSRVPVSKPIPTTVPVSKLTPTAVPVSKPTPTTVPVSKLTPSREPISKPTPTDEAAQKPIPSETTVQTTSSYEATGQIETPHWVPTLYKEASVQRPASNEGPVKKPTLKVPYPRPSWLTRAEQSLYIVLYNRFVTPGAQLSPIDVKHFQDLHVRVAAEQEEYMSYLQMVATKHIEDYTCIQPDVESYIAKYLEKSRRRVVDYSRFYVQYESVSLQPSRKPPQIPFVHQQLLLEMGKVSVVTPPNLNVPNKPKVRVDAKKLNRLFPPESAYSDRNERATYQVCSSDENAAKLAKKNRVNVVLSSSALQCLVDNFAPTYSQQWEMPVIIKQYSIINDSGEEEVHKVVYVDKPFTPKVLHTRDRNMKYHKCGLKLKLQHSTSKVTFSDLRKLQETTPIIPASQPDTPLDPRSLDHAADTTGVFDSTSIEDLETFGMSYKKQKGRTMMHSDRQDSNSINKTSVSSTGNVQQAGFTIFDSVSPTRVAGQSDKEQSDLESDRFGNLEMLDQLDGTSDRRGRGRRSSSRVRQKSADEIRQTGQTQGKEISTSNRMVTRHRLQLESNNEASVSGDSLTSGVHLTRGVPKRKHPPVGEAATGYSDKEVKESFCRSPATRGKRRKQEAEAIQPDVTFTKTRNIRKCQNRNVRPITRVSTATNRMSESTDSDSEGRLVIDVQYTSQADTSQSDLEESVMLAQEPAAGKVKVELTAENKLDSNVPVVSTAKTVTKLECDKQDAHKLHCPNNPSPGTVSPRRKRGRPPKRRKEKLADTSSLVAIESSCETRRASAERTAVISNVDGTKKKKVPTATLR